MRFNPDEYISVSERIEKFYAKFGEGRILTSVVEHDRESGFILVRAEVFRNAEDSLPSATGHAYELKSAGHVQAGSYVEVCETSAVGRALALLGFEVKRGVASREEVIRGAQKAQARPQPVAPVPAEEETDEAHAGADEQVMALLKLLGKKDKDLNDYAGKKYNAGQVIPWEDYNLATKRALIAFLQEKAPKQATA